MLRRGQQRYVESNNIALLIQSFQIRIFRQSCRFGVMIRRMAKNTAPESGKDFYHSSADVPRSYDSYRLLTEHPAFEIIQCVIVDLLQPKRLLILS